MGRAGGSEEWRWTTTRKIQRQTTSGEKTAHEVRWGEDYETGRKAEERTTQHSATGRGILVRIYQTSGERGAQQLAGDQLAAFPPFSAPGPPFALNFKKGF